MTATIPTVAAIVGSDREAEARALLEELIAITNETDPDLAHIVRRRVLDLQTWDIIAAEVEMPIGFTYRVFMQWAEEIKFLLTRTQTERAAT